MIQSQRDRAYIEFGVYIMNVYEQSNNTQKNPKGMAMNNQHTYIVKGTACTPPADANHYRTKQYYTTRHQA
jgi:hypothetical protein